MPLRELQISLTYNIDDIILFFLIFKGFFGFFFFKRKKKSIGGGGEEQRERERESLAGSTPNMEPDVRLHLTTLRNQELGT